MLCILTERKKARLRLLHILIRRLSFKRAVLYFCGYS